MQDLTAKLTFKVPEDSTHQAAGTKIDKSFDYQFCDTVAEAEAVATKKEWTLLEFVNDALKQNARANCYQNQLALYVPKTEISLDAIKERLVRDFIRSGLSEDVAKTQVDSILAANNG